MLQLLILQLCMKFYSGPFWFRNNYNSNTSFVRPMLSQTRVVKSLGWILCIRGISNLPTDSVFCTHNAVSIGWVKEYDILWPRWFSTCSNSTLPVDDFTTNCSKICFVGSCFTWDTALSISWPIGNNTVSFSENHVFYLLLVQKNHLL